MIPSDVRSANKKKNNKATTQVSDGSLYLGLETTLQAIKVVILSANSPFDAAKISIFLLSSKLFPTFFYFEGKITNKICTFAPAIRLMRQRCHLRTMEPIGGALHYGISDTVRYVFGSLNYHNKRDRSKTIAEVTPTDVYIRSRSVPRAIHALTHTFGCIVYTPLRVSNLFVLTRRLPTAKVVGRAAGDTLVLSVL